jgi:hypothetical protein
MIGRDCEESLPLRYLRAFIQFEFDPIFQILAESGEHPPWLIWHFLLFSPVSPTSDILPLNKRPQTPPPASRLARYPAGFHGPDEITRTSFGSNRAPIGLDFRA